MGSVSQAGGGSAAAGEHDHDADYEPAGAVAALVDAAPGALDTLNELAAALGDDANFASTVTTALAGKADTADLDDKADALVAANRQTASYTLVLSDVDKVVEMNVAGANTLTFPPDVFSAGDCGEGVQWGAGEVTLTEGVGVDIRSSGDKFKTAAQYASFSWRCVTPTEFHVAGDLTA